MRIVVKVGSSSLTNQRGQINDKAIGKLCAEVVELRANGHEVLLVSSGAIAAGLPSLGYVDSRPKDTLTLQAAAAVGQSQLMARYSGVLGTEGYTTGQILLSPWDFFHRQQYLHARDTLNRLLQLGVIPIINENDAVADDEIRFGDNDRLSALVANATRADLLVLLTDTEGLFTADPRTNADATLIEEVAEIDDTHLAGAGEAGSARGSGGMSSKVMAARMASWSGVEVVIAASARGDVLADAVAGRSVGTTVRKRLPRLSARKVWIAFAAEASGALHIDPGAVKALQSGRSLLPAGVTAVEGDYYGGAAVMVLSDNQPVAKGLCRYSSADLERNLGKHTSEVEAHLRAEVISREDLVLL